MASHGTSAWMDPISAITRWQNSLVAKPGFQTWASRFPLMRRIARKDGEKLFDLVAGFVYSQTLFACVELDIISKLTKQPSTASTLSLSCGVSAKRMEILCNSAVSIGLLKLKKDGCYHVARLGAALIGVPGLVDMVRHHDILYRDMTDPVALLRDEVETELAQFWPYVLNQSSEAPGDAVVEKYSNLMAQSQALVAEETLALVSFEGIETLMDVGGGTGAFLRAVGDVYPALSRVLFDLPEVVGEVTAVKAVGGSFLDPLPQCADAISLIRVLYDHSDSTIEQLLKNIIDALPPKGKLIISEPMSGGTKPERATDAYFAFYTMAMRTGQVRSQKEIAEKLTRVGFSEIRSPRSYRPYVTSVVTAQKPA